MEGNDLIFVDGFIYMKTTRGLVQVVSSIAVLMINTLIQCYFRKDSLGVPLVESVERETYL